jgi:hypothetical protein
MKHLIYGILLITMGQLMVWFQVNGQFFWKWAKDHPFMMALLFSTPISIVLIKATQYITEHFDGLLWPGRFIGFASGVLVFSICTSTIMGEGINHKTLVSLILSMVVVLVQILWK